MANLTAVRIDESIDFSFFCQLRTLKLRCSGESHLFDSLQSALRLDGLVREDVHLRVGEQVEVHVGHHARFTRHAEG